MVRFLSTVSTGILLLCLGTSSNAYSVLGPSSMTSTFGGKVLLTGGTTNGATMEMKKGKSNVPVQMRSNYKRQKQMAEMRDQMVANSKPGPDGLPIFNLYVRTDKANMWYPCGSFKGDERSAALAKNYADDGLLSGISKNQLDGGIAGSLAQDIEKLKETVCRAYPQLRKSRNVFEFGYKLGYDGLSEEKSAEIFPVEPKEQKGPLDGIRNMFK